MSTIRNICVYCGSSPGTDPRFVTAPPRFGAILADNGIGLVYGGGSVGLMGAVSAATSPRADAVTGVIPEFLVQPRAAIGGRAGADRHARHA